MSSQELPPWSSLPVDPAHPQGSAWIWGKDDELGRLNLLTPARVAAAARLIQTGDRVSLNWPLDKPSHPSFGRKGLQHQVLHKTDVVNDDEISFNTQCGTQLDGFFHFGFHKEKVFYNGRTQEDLDSGKCQGIAAWAKKGIAGTGVLLDYYSWAQANGKSYDPLSSHPIPLSDLKACMSAQNVTVRTGDIFLIRFGFIEASNKASEETLLRLAKEPAFAGVEQTEEMKRFLYETGACLLASDVPAFERWPPKPFALHEFIIGGWGVVIGEMMDLEALAQTCERLKRRTFFFSAQPLTIPGGVASPPNAMAIF